MNTRALRRQSQVCQLYKSLAIHNPRTRNSLRTDGGLFRSGRQLVSQRRHATQPTLRATATLGTGQEQLAVPQVYTTSSTATSISNSSSAPTGSDISPVETACERIINDESIPKEEVILSVLEKCQILARQLIKPEDSQLKSKDGSAASALLEVEEPDPVKVVPKSDKISPAVQSTVNKISQTAYNLLLPHKCYVTPKILQKYVDLQYTLQKPETLPEMFYLYANKPIPELGSSPVKYRKPNPNKAANAVSLAVADRALQTAINAKALAVAMNIVGTTYATTASRRAKFIRKGLLPATGLAAAPVAAYTVATQFGLYQSSMDPQMATNMAFVGILAYLGFTTTIGVVAVTTANDQMDRVTWATGMPLRERWIREEERAAIDKIAGAWGFRQTWRRGEEEGQDWDTLREWIGRKGMVLDRSELMEGME